jgi:type I restriction enzyme S subunit
VVDDINSIIDKVILLREQANDLLDEANKLVYKYNHLPELNIDENQYSDGENKIQTRVLKSSSIFGEYRLDAHFYNPIAELAIRNIASNSESNKLLNEVATPTYMGSRASRNYVEKGFGVQFLSGKNIVQIRPTDPKYLSKQETENLEELLLQKGWILITRSGTLGRTVLVWNNYENVAASEHLIRVIPKNNEIDSGYLFAFLSSDYGYHQLVKFKHGAVIDEITEDQIGETVIPIPKSPQRKVIGDKVRQAYEKRGEAIHLEDEAQEILKQSLEG